MGIPWLADRNSLAPYDAQFILISHQSGWQTRRELILNFSVSAQTIYQITNLKSRSSYVKLHTEWETLGKDGFLRQYIELINPNRFETLWDRPKFMRDALVIEYQHITRRRWNCGGFPCIICPAAGNTWRWAELRRRYRELSEAFPSYLAAFDNMVETLGEPDLTLDPPSRIPLLPKPGDQTMDDQAHSSFPSFDDIDVASRVKRLNAGKNTPELNRHIFLSLQQGWATPAHICAIYSVSRATVQKLAQLNSGQYVDIKDEWIELGPRGFFERFFLPDEHAKIEAYKIANPPAPPQRRPRA